MSQNRHKSNQNITPPSSFVDLPLTPPLTDEKPSAQVPRIIALFYEIQAGKHSNRGSWIEFQLAEGDYDKIIYLLGKDEELRGFVEDKIRYDYIAERDRLVVRMPTDIHETFIARIEDAIFSQLKSIREGSDEAAAFAQRVNPARSTDIFFPVENDPGRRSKHDPDASFWHRSARYPGVVIEVAYSQDRKKLDRLAEDYLLDSDASIQAVVGLDIEYGKKGSRKATLSVWRAQVFRTATEDELRVVKEVADEALRDDQGNSTDHPGLRLRLSDFANKRLVQKELGDKDREICISGERLCGFLAEAESKIQEAESSSLGWDFVAPGVKKRRRSETPSEKMASADEARFVAQERRVVRRMDAQDSDYDDTSSLTSSFRGSEA